MARSPAGVKGDLGIGPWRLSLGAWASGPPQGPMVAPGVAGASSLVERPGPQWGLRGCECPARGVLGGAPRGPGRRARQPEPVEEGEVHEGAKVLAVLARDGGSPHFPGAAWRARRRARPQDPPTAPTTGDPRGASSAAPDGPAAMPPATSVGEDRLRAAPPERPGIAPGARRPGRARAGTGGRRGGRRARGCCGPRKRWAWRVGRHGPRAVG